MMRPPLVLKRVLDELKTRQADGIENQVVTPRAPSSNCRQVHKS